MKYLLFVVTGTLMLLSSSCVELYTSLVVFAVSIITTYICYTLQTQLKLDKVIKALCNFRKKGKKYFFYILLKRQSGQISSTPTKNTML